MNGTWAYSSLPVYDFRSGTGDRKAKRTNKAPKKLKSSDGPLLSKPQPFSPKRPTPPSHIPTHVMSTDFMGPAIDGPPSPESIRALNKQMKRTSVLDKHQSHQTSSSGSSSLRSLASGTRPSWEHGSEGITLSRKSSGRSTAGSMPTRERPDSVQIFGKTIFNRRGKLRRETSAQSSSASSLYSAETNEAIPAPTSMPTKDFSSRRIFGRRKTLKSEATDAVAGERKYQISEPYNFQHVTHPNSEHTPEGQWTGRMGSVAEYDTQFADFSSEALPLPEGAEQALPNRPSSFMPQQSQRRMMQHSQSQDQLRVPPPRPPRSPVDPEHTLNPPVPPPRFSSRVSMRYDGFDPLASTELERPLTSGGFRHPRPFGFPNDRTPPRATSPTTAMPADDANWPLPCPSSPIYESLLAGVPEEDENAPAGRPSRASMASNSSSLRASQSVPLLRQLSLSKGPASPGFRRPPSAASDTLGRFDLLAAQRALKAALIEGTGADEVARESWEDDIDWCYEHEAEADCDFAWDRPSLDISRDGDATTPVESDRRQNLSADVSPAMLTPSQFDMPALSPCSQASTTTAQEAITPTASAVPKASNFSLPKRDGTQSQRYLHVRKSSDASSFKESHGFTLSPSLLIPTDYREQMQAHEAEKHSPHNLSYQVPYEEPTLTMDKSALFVYPRTSASTTGSNETDRSQYSERHISTTSTSTDFTRLTMSSTSLDIENFIPKPEIEVMPPPIPQLEEAVPVIHARAKSHGNIMPSLSESEEMLDQPGPLRRDLSASDPNLVRLADKSPVRRKDPLLTRRRARTTSLSTPPPPGQYALFPSVQISGNRI